jgi:hypothetical protein
MKITNQKNIKWFQWILLTFFALPFFTRTYTLIFKDIVWVINNSQIINFKYINLYIIVLTNILAIIGLYLISRFIKRGFVYFYIGFVFSFIDDFLRIAHLYVTGIQNISTSVIYQLIALLGNLFFLVLFYFGTKSILKKSI